MASRLQTDRSSRASMSSERQTRSLREVHERLVSYVAAKSNLCNATMALADSIVDFYLPEVGGCGGRETSAPGLRPTV